ncbi:MAG: histone [Thermofilum sp. ex4484_82]|nr:histone family protein [Thermoproteales archaeon]OYT25836.1 MAG: histone [Thermofilum sp. ex4484_82]OYT36414.1 MAG: histone [Archaeoglobales archaeon ex4484_92]RLE76152.1 MAG: histone [Thermoprotei archaeon]RLE78156.1 MAG: histone [Thermoprotei archaeon]
MKVRKKEIPLAPIERILHQEGGKRVSEEATRLLRDIIEEIARFIAREACELAAHADRKTVMKEDIIFAAKRIGKQTPFFIE